MVCDFPETNIILEQHQENGDLILEVKPTVVLKKTDKTSKNESNDVSEEHDSVESQLTAVESRAVKRKKLQSKPTTITIPIKNAVVQALTQVDPHEAEAASYSPSREYNPDRDVVYEDEMQELDGWIPPPPPPPEDIFHRPLLSASTFTRLASMRAPAFLSGRLFGDDFALFLVILTVAGFFGLMLSMFMPFTFMMQQQQPYSVSSGYPGYGQVGSMGTSGIYGYPYGRRRRRRSTQFSHKKDIAFHTLIKSFEKHREWENYNTHLKGQDLVNNTMPFTSDFIKSRQK